MSLRKRHDPDIPGKTEGPAKCRFETNGMRCNKSADIWVEGNIDVLGKQVPIKLPICAEHANRAREKNASDQTDG